MALTRSVIDVKGRPTEVVEGGTGDPLVFLHGGSMIGGVDFLDALTDRFHVYVPFLPGYGGTESGPPLKSRDDAVDNIADVLDALGVGEVVLVAHSLGGWRAAAFAARYPERVRRLVFGAPLGMHVPGHSVANMMELTPEERLDVLTYDDAIKKSWMPSGPDAEYMAARVREQQSMANFAPGPFDADLPDLVATIEAPTVVLWGEGDRLLPVAQAQAWAEAMPHAQVRTYPGAGHLIFHERPETVEVIATGETGAAQ